jgi:hypothetical protein
MNYGMDLTLGGLMMTQVDYKNELWYGSDP